MFIFLCLTFSPSLSVSVQLLHSFLLPSHDPVPCTIGVEQFVQHTLQRPRFYDLFPLCAELKLSFGGGRRISLTYLKSFQRASASLACLRQPDVLRGRTTAGKNKEPHFMTDKTRFYLAYSPHTLSLPLSLFLLFMLCLYLWRNPSAVHLTV